MTKAGLTDVLVEKSGLSKKDAEMVVETIFASMAEALAKGHRVELRGFGILRVRHRRPRVGRNPKTGASVVVPPKRAVLFKPSQTLERALNPPSQANQLAKG